MDYQPSTLVRLKSKGNKWYVQVTMPPELQNGTTKQVRRSTGTTDERAAQRIQHRKTKEIYAEFDRKLGIDRSAPAPNVTYIDSHPDPFAAYRPWPAFHPDNPKLRVLVLRPEYIERRNWKREKSKKGANSHIREFGLVVGNLPVDKLKKVHAYDYAQYLDDMGRANSTIKTRVSSVKNLLTWCEQRGLIESNPFINLSLVNYGFPTKKYKPLSGEELVRLFQQDMNDRDRLCMSILAITGMRLDEVALLDWKQVKEDAGIVYLDLTEAMVKTGGSNRKVPLHRDFTLPKRGSGRVFDYNLGDDGKAQSYASRQLMPILRKAVGNNPRKVVNSLRGTFKDMIRNTDSSKELNDFITGHNSGDVAGDYGEGHALALRAIAVNKLDISFLGQ